MTTVIVGAMMSKIDLTGPSGRRSTTPEKPVPAERPAALDVLFL